MIPSNGGSLSDLSSAETLDLFNSLGSVIATTTVGDGVGTQVGTWWAFNNLTSAQTLSPGTYYVAALLNSDDNASFPAPAPTVGADITFDQFEYCNSNVANPPNNPTNTSTGCGLSTADFLTSTNSSLGFLGGNIEYTDPPARVPEPSSLAILGARPDRPWFCRFPPPKERRRLSRQKLHSPVRQFLVSRHFWLRQEL